MTMFSILDKEGNLQPADVLQWANYFESADRAVGLDEIKGWRISTVFFGLDHCLWETVVFTPQDENIYQARYNSREAAEEGHRKAILWVEKQIDLISTWKDPAKHQGELIEEERP
jgi:hypothetical protein